MASDSEEEGVLLFTKRWSRWKTEGGCGNGGAQGPLNLFRLVLVGVSKHTVNLYVDNCDLVGRFV